MFCFLFVVFLMSPSSSIALFLLVGVSELCWFSSGIVIVGDKMGRTRNSFVALNNCFLERPFCTGGNPPLLSFDWASLWVVVVVDSSLDGVFFWPFVFDVSADRDDGTIGDVS